MPMINYIRQIVLEAARRAHAAGDLRSGDFPADAVVEEPKIESHGDFATNFAMLSAKAQKMAPRQIAQVLVDHLDDPRGYVDRAEIAGPGFLNFFLKPLAWPPVIGSSEFS